jgi:hypothetical protein
MVLSQSSKEKRRRRALLAALLARKYCCWYWMSKKKMRTMRGTSCQTVAFSLVVSFLLPTDDFTLFLHLVNSKGLQLELGQDLLHVLALLFKYLPPVNFFGDLQQYLVTSFPVDILSSIAEIAQ